MAGSPPHDFQSDSDDDGDIYIPTFAQNTDSREFQAEIRRTSDARLPFKSGEKTRKKRHSEELREASKVAGMRRSTSEGDLLNRVETVTAGGDIQKSKSDSHRIDDNVSITTSDNVSIATKSDYTDDDISVMSKEQEAEIRNGGQLARKPYR